MKVLLFIDSLNSGGAQRQIVNLGILLNQKGYQVKIVRYYQHNHFENILTQNNIQSDLIEAHFKILRIYKLFKIICSWKPDILISYLDIPSFIAIISTIFGRLCRIIVSERVMEIGKPSLFRKMLRKLYRYVDYVTTNSYGNKDLILKSNSKINNKLRVIYNCVDIERFYPNKEGLVSSNRIIIVASFRDTKNPQGLIKAVDVINKKIDISFKVDWFGHKNPSKIKELSSNTYDESMEIINRLKLNKIIKLRNSVVDIENKYRKSSALILPSFTEGVPNVVCEAMACGLPVIISNVADAQNIVEEGINGFLFDPYSQKSLSDAIIKYLTLECSERKIIGNNNVIKAKKLFSNKKYCDNYIKLINPND